MAFLLCACGQGSYTGEDIVDPDDPANGGNNGEDRPGGEGEEEETPVPIFISMGGLDSQLDRAAAREESTENQENTVVWNEKYVYIYAFRRTGEQPVYTLPATATDEGDCLIHALLDGGTAPQGKPAIVTSYSQYLTWKNEPKQLYYPNDNTGYDFFGYYMDGLDQSGLSGTDGTVSMVVDLAPDHREEVVPGTRDLMVAMAALTLPAESSYTEEEKRDLQRYYFSAYTAQRGLHPDLSFEHALCRFRFKVRAHRADLQDVKVTRVTVTAPRKVTFTVAAPQKAQLGATPVAGEQHPYRLRAPYDATSTDNPYPEMPVTDVMYAADEKQYDPLGGTLILPAKGNGYRCRIDMTQTINGVTKENYTIVDLSPPGGGTFEAGKTYTASIDVYGIEELHVNIGLEPWRVGGTITVDPDADFGKREGEQP